MSAFQLSFVFVLVLATLTPGAALATPEVWGITTGNIVRRFQLDGTIIGDLDPAPGPTNPVELAVVNGEVWAALGNATIQPIAFDTTLLTLFSSGAQDVVSMVATPEPSTALLLASGLVALAVGRRRRS